MTSEGKGPAMYPLGWVVEDTGRREPVFASPDRKECERYMDEHKTDGRTLRTVQMYVGCQEVNEG